MFCTGSVRRSSLRCVAGVSPARSGTAGRRLARAGLQAGRHPRRSRPRHDYLARRALAVLPHDRAPGECAHRLIQVTLPGDLLRNVVCTHLLFPGQAVRAAKQGSRRQARRAHQRSELAKTKRGRKVRQQMGGMVHKTAKEGENNTKVRAEPSRLQPIAMVSGSTARRWTRQNRPSFSSHH